MRLARQAAAPGVERVVHHHAVAQHLVVVGKVGREALAEELGRATLAAPQAVERPAHRESHRCEGDAQRGNVVDLLLRVPVFVPGTQDEIEKYAGGKNNIKYYMLAGAVIYEIPIGMIFLSRYLSYDANRWTNIGAAALTAPRTSAAHSRTARRSAVVVAPSAVGSSSATVSLR